MNKLNFFKTPKENLKINVVFRDEKRLESVRADSA